MDLKALAILATDYEAAHMPRAAAEIRKWQEKYRYRQ
jgi:hypothetical protein